MAGLVHLIAYSDGEVRQEFTFVYAAEIQSGELKIHHESKEASWIPVGCAVELPLAESQRRRSKDSRVSEGPADVFAIFRASYSSRSRAENSMGTADPNGI